jgi:hypothetical protein
VLSDHYNNTVSDFKKLGKSREANFIAILILLGVMAFQYVSPEQSQGILVQFIQKKLDINAALSVNLIGSLIWFTLLYVTVKYFQTVINIEKQYNYTHQLEKELAKSYNGKAFTREGVTYLKNYALFSDWVHIIYWYIFPALFTIVITIKIFSEWTAQNQNGISIVLDTVIWLALTVSTALYIYSLHKTAKNTEEDL